MGLVSLELRDFRNVENAHLELAPGLNVFYGRNAQGKTALLEACGLLARGRSFRTEDTRSLIRRGAAALAVKGQLTNPPNTVEIRISTKERQCLVDGSQVKPAAYYGRLDVVLYATERLSVVRGPMRERRQFVDRSAAALWPSYRQLLRDYERTVQQRNAALERGSTIGQEPWDESLVLLGARLRYRRANYICRLEEALGDGSLIAQEIYGISPDPSCAHSSEEAAAEALRRDMNQKRSAERRARKSLVGPHRDRILLTIDGVDTSNGASAGQARSLLLALTLASFEVQRHENGRPPVALLDDLDSELDDERAGTLCHLLADRGQALVTTAHEAWARRVTPQGRCFHVAGGRFAPA